jgi:cell division protease FtsH
MVTKWGLSQKVGPLTLGGDDEEVFLGHSITRHKDISEATSSMVDTEVREIIERNYQRAEHILKENIDKLHTMAEALVKYETLGQDQIQDIMSGKPMREPSNWRNKDSVGQSKDPTEAKNGISVQDPTKRKQDNENEGTGTASANGTSVN